MHIPNHFQLHELVPESVYKQRDGSPALWWVFDPRILRAADVLRERYGPMVCNTWRSGAQIHFRGFRPPTTDVGAVLSQHRFGRALDLIPQKCTAEEIRQDIISNPDMVQDITGTWLITAMETGVDWLHIDCRNHDPGRAGFKLFKKKG